MNQTTTDKQASPRPKGSIIVRNVHLPFRDKVQIRQRWTVECSAGRVAKISPSNENENEYAPIAQAGLFEAPTESAIDGTNSLLLPS
jgi:hypothetical protein